MDYLQEGIFLGIDLLILGACAKEYFGYKKCVSLLKNAPQFPINSDLRSHLESQESRKIPYCVIRGTVSPIGVPIRSVLSPSVTGVLQVVKLSEHRVARGFVGLWTEQKKLIHMSSNDMPFELRHENSGVEVVNALSAAVLDMDIVYDNYEPSSLSLFDHIFGFFSGVRQKGLQTTEEFLRDGSYITGIGELELDGNTIRLQPSRVGPLLLTTATKSTLIKKFEEAKSSMLFRVIICGSIAAVLVTVIAKKYFKKLRMERAERKLKETLEKERRERRAKSRPQHVSPEQVCVVCNQNPKEVILLPCGHVCICEDCSERIQLRCPVCRTKIETKSAAFIA